MENDYDLKKLQPQENAPKKHMCNWQDSGMTCEFEAAADSLWCPAHHEIHLMRRNAYFSALFI